MNRLDPWGLDLFSTDISQDEWNELSKEYGQGCDPKLSIRYGYCYPGSGYSPSDPMEVDVSSNTRAASGIAALGGVSIFIDPETGAKYTGPQLWLKMGQELAGTAANFIPVDRLAGATLGTAAWQAGSVMGVMGKVVKLGNLGEKGVSIGKKPLTSQTERLAWFKALGFITPERTGLGSSR